MRRLCLISALVILGCPYTTASQGEFSSIAVFLKSTLKGEDELILEARGDLNSDGLLDWAGVVRRPKEPFLRMYQLYVLLRQPQSGYSVGEKTEEQGVGGLGDHGVEDLKIRRSSIYLSTYSKSVKDFEDVSHQFKLYKNEWRLVGIRIHYQDNSTQEIAETHMNYLTGAVIEKRQKRRNKPITRRRHKKFATFLLKDYDFVSSFGIEENP